MDTKRDEADGDVPELSGAHVGAQRIGGAPEVGFEADGGGAVVVLGHSLVPSIMVFRAQVRMSRRVALNMLR